MPDAKSQTSVVATPLASWRFTWGVVRRRRERWWVVTQGERNDGTAVSVVRCPYSRRSQAIRSTGQWHDSGLRCRCRGAAASERGHRRQSPRRTPAWVLRSSHSWAFPNRGCPPRVVLQYRSSPTIRLRRGLFLDRSRRPCSNWERMDIGSDVQMNCTRARRARTYGDVPVRDRARLSLPYAPVFHCHYTRTECKPEPGYQDSRLRHTMANSQSVAPWVETARVSRVWRSNSVRMST